MKKCTGCDRLDNEPLGLNNKGIKYSACCPDNNYVEISAVEWLKIKYKQQGLLFNKDLSQAKEMEEAQRKNDFRAGWNGNKHKDWNCEFYLIKHIANDFKTE